MTGSAFVPRPVRRAISVRELTTRLQAALQESFPARFWVEGELSSFKVGRNGHAFCCLKEGDAQVEAVIWGRDLLQLSFTPPAGSLVLALVRKVDFYAPHGQLRLHLERIEPQGIGALYRALEERKKRLAAEGLFDEARKRALPFLPRTVGIATAATGAAIRDVLEILDKRFAERRILLRPCRVQGDGAAADIAQALDDLNRHGTVEVIIVGRGGGSIEDLWAFNEEVVVRAIARSRVPVVSAVGHETDWTLADLVADLRVPTPTAAAQRVMPERSALDAELARQGARLERALRHRLAFARAKLSAWDAALADPRRPIVERRLRLDGLARRAREALRALTPGRRTRLARAAAALTTDAPRSAPRRAELEHTATRMTAAWQTCLFGAQSALGARAAQLEALSPLAVLSRGFAVARRDDGTIVRDGGSLQRDEELALRFARGTARARVLEAAEEPVVPPRSSPPR